MKPAPGIPNTPVILALSVAVIDLDEEYAHLLWRAAWASTDPQVRAWRFSVDHAMTSLLRGVGTQNLLDNYLHSTFSAKTICDLVERLWHENLLTRRQANAYQNGILRFAGPTGQWLISKYTPADEKHPAGIQFQNIYHNPLRKSA
jgi:hypothetical protein